MPIYIKVLDFYNLIKIKINVYWALHAKLLNTLNNYFI